MESWSVSCIYWGSSDDWEEIQLSEREARELFARQAAYARSARVDELELWHGKELVAHWYYDEEADQW